MAAADDDEIVAEGLRKTFGDTVAIDGVSFRLRRGEVAGFLGPNGAGKSTTLRILTGVFPPTAGRARIAGHDLVRDGLAARRMLGYMPERTALYGDMTVGDYLRFVAEMKDVGTPRTRGRAIEAAMDAAAVRHVAHRRTGDLSKGYRQRVGIAQALLGNPPVLVLDEPTSGLDPEQVSDIRALIQGLGRDRTVLLSTHVLPEVESICSRVLVMHKGRLLADDEPARLERRLRAVRLVAVRVAGDVPRAVAAIRGIAGVRDVEIHGAVASTDETELRVSCDPDADLRRAIAAAVEGATAGLLELRPVAMTLEEIFLALVGRAPVGDGLQAAAPSTDRPEAARGSVA